MTEMLNPVALITGAASGVGKACAQRLAAQATGGLILIDQGEERLAAAADALVAAPERVSTLPFNAGDQKWWKRAGEFVENQYGRLDWAVVNAGASPSGQEDWRAITGLNMEAAVLSLRAIIALMQHNRDGGVIVLTGAITSDGKKAGLMQVLRVAAKEGARHGVRVNAVTPAADLSLVRNAPSFEGMVRELGNRRAAFERMMEAQTPLVHCAESEDATSVILMLLAQSAPLSGAALVVDGGYTL